MIQIRPVSDLRNKFPDIEKAVGGGDPVYLTKNGYGAKKNENVSIKNIRENRKKEEIKTHKNHVREAGL